MKYAESTIRKHRKKWLDALESGELAQCKGALVKTRQSTGEPVSFCCLGVASILSGTPYKNRKGTEVNNWRHGFLYFDNGDEYSTHELLPKQAQEWLGLLTDDPYVNLPSDHPKMRGWLAGRSLASLNDAGVSFAEIAALIREYGFVEEHDVLKQKVLVNG